MKIWIKLLSTYEINTLSYMRHLRRIAAEYMCKKVGGGRLKLLKPRFKPLKIQ